MSSPSDRGLAGRMARLIVHGRAPYNAEPPLDRLRASWRTAADDFYVRSHGDLPVIDAGTYRIAVGGAVGAGRCPCRSTRSAPCRRPP